MHYLLHQVVLLSQGVHGLPFLLQGKTQVCMCTLQPYQRGGDTKAQAAGLLQKPSSWVLLIRFNLAMYLTPFLLWTLHYSGTASVIPNLQYTYELL